MNPMSFESLNYPVRFNRPASWLAASDGLPDKGPGKSAMPAQPGEKLLGKRILIVEDEGLVALEMQLAFEDDGAEVIGPAQSLMTALEAVSRDTEIDLAVLDVDLGGENVYPVAELLRRRGVPFVFHTGHGSRSELNALFPGAATFTKPTLPEALIAHLIKIGR